MACPKRATNLPGILSASSLPGAASEYLLLLSEVRKRNEQASDGASVWYPPNMIQMNSNRVLLLLLPILSGVLILPLVLCHPLPLNDYPDHLARMYIIAHAASSSTLGSFYAVRWAVIPNLAMDLIVPPLVHIMPLQSAGAFFTACTMIGLPLGVVAVSKQFFGHISWLSLCGFLMVYNRILLWGFLNYEFGLACAFFAFAVWLALRNRNLWVRSVMLLGSGCVIFIFHLAAFGTFCVLVASYEAYDLYAGRVGLRNALSRTVSIFIPLAIAGSLILLGPTRRRIHGFAFGPLWSRFSDLLYIFFAYNLWFDLLTFLLVFGGISVALWTGFLKIKPHACVALAMLLFFYAVIPYEFLSSHGVGERLIIGFFLLLAASLDFSPLDSASSKRYVVLAILILFGVRMGLVCINWMRADRYYASIQEAMLDVPPAQRVAPFVLHYSSPVLANPPVAQIVSTLVWERQDFVPIFAELGQQPLQYRTPIHRVADDSDITLDIHSGQTRLTHPFAHFHPSEFDYVVIVGRHGFPEALPRYLDLISLRNDVGVYKVDRH